ncbi:MAG: TonB-dependent receptor [Flavobacteriales bacterium]|jgi:TonB-dependent receptor
MKVRTFKKQILAASIAVAISATATAQEVSDNEAEELVVTGIRASLQRSMDIKRNSQGVVDAISSEDIGKFPDQNLAESLQRITGVSIDRNNGEGQSITVRGLGPDFNLVTLNGRQMPTSGLNGTSVNGSRSFDFNNIASEGIAGVDVYKTSRANIATGGMGATVNVRTTRPLETPGLHFSVGAKGVYDESRNDVSLTPELSGMISQTFAEDKFGVALAVSIQEREGGARGANVPDGWHTQSVVPNGGWFGGLASESGAFNDNDTFQRPQNFEYGFTEFTRDRTNAQLTLQFAPTEDITATLDYTYSELEIASTTNAISVWFWEGELVNDVDSEFVLGSESATGNNYYPVVFNHAGGDDLVFVTGDFAQKNENNSIGLNLDWNVTDNLRLNFDFHDSDASSTAASPFGNSSVISSSAFVREGAVVDFSQGFAALGAHNPAGGEFVASDISSADLQPVGSSLRNSEFTNDVQQTQLSGEYTFEDGPITSIDFGVAKTENSIHRGIMIAQRDTWGSGDGTPEEFRDDIFEARSISGQFGSFPTTGRYANSEETFATFDLMFAFDFVDAAADVVASQAPANSDNIVSPGIWPCADRFCVTDQWTTDQKTAEEYSSAFAQVNFEFEIGAAVLGATVGARYEETEVASSAVVPAFTGIAWVTNNEFSLAQEEGVSSETDFRAKYDHFLPNIDLNLTLPHDVVIRASYSQTIARATYDSIAGGVAINTLRQIDGDAVRGDPTLLPHESTNLDLSVEWYFDDASYVSASWFSKEVDNFVGSGTTTENLFGLRNPSGGPRAIEARANVVDPTDGDSVLDYIRINFPETVSPTGGILSVAEDPLYQFNVTVPINERKAEITGLELAVQHTLEMGFGAQLNYTFVDSDREYDNSEFDQQFALEGLSDTANAVVFYENFGVQARLAYNWRDSFLAQTVRNHGNPAINEEYSQWDFNVSYDVNEELTVFVEGLNITDETQRVHGRYENNLLNATELGARYAIGARYTF